MWLVKFFWSLCCKLYFYHFTLLTSFLAASNRRTKTVSLISSYLHREAIASHLPDSWFVFSKYKNPKCSDKEPRPHFNDHKLSQHLYEAALILIQNWWDEIVAAAPAWLIFTLVISSNITNIHFGDDNRHFNGFHSIVRAHLNQCLILLY